MGRSPERRRSRSRSRERDSKRRRDLQHNDRREDVRAGGRDYRDSRDRGGYGGDRHHDRGRSDRDDYRRRGGRDAGGHRHGSRGHRDEEYGRRERSPRGRTPLEQREEDAAVAQPAAGAANGDETATANNHSKPEVLSLEELLRKKQEEQVEQARPVFMTKEERAKAALARRAEEAAAYRSHTDGLRLGLAEAAGRGGAAATSAGPSGSYDVASRARDRERERELELIKQQYLGGEKKKKKIIKVADRFKFTFDWDASEDTSRDLNPLYQDPHEAALLFGRGFRGGFDRREQRRTGVEAEAATLRRVRAASGVEETGDDRRRAAAKVDRADRFDDRGAMRVDTHWSEKPREAMTERDWRIFREDFNIAYKGSIAPEEFPVRNWDEAMLPEPVLRGVERAGYKKPSPIQMASIPLGLCQRDVIGVAETGSGKTAAFVLPMLVYIMRQPVMAGNPDIEAEGPYAVILAPTRELAQQIEEEARALAHFTGFRVVSVVGGQSIEDQGFALRKGCEIVVATPGRLVDCVERRYAVLNQCNYVVLDEADRMIDMGFEPQVMGVLDAMPSSNLKPENEDEPLEANRVYRTTYMFSATMPPAVERLARKYLRRPIVVNIGSAGQATQNVTQRVVWVKENEKPSALGKELQAAGDSARVIVFANTQKKCEQVLRIVDNFGYSAAMLHGGKTQDQREESIKGFREDRYSVLVATDVAGRGIDVPNVALVVNYDMPLTIEAYTHRIGRTGRAGRKGNATTLLTIGDTEVFFDLKKFLEDSKAAVPRELANHEASRQKPGGEGRRASVQYAKR